MEEHSHDCRLSVEVNVVWALTIVTNTFTPLSGISPILPRPAAVESEVNVEEHTHESELSVELSWF